MGLWCPARDACRDDVHVTSVPSHLRKVCGRGNSSLARHLWRRKDGLATLVLIFYDLISH